MQLDRFRENANQVERYCNSRGLGEEAKDFLMQMALDQMRQQDELLAKEPELASRFTPLTDLTLDRWLEQMNGDQHLF